MLLDKGTKVHIITRRLFEADLRRHFISEVKERNGQLVLVEGYPIVFMHALNQFVRKNEKRLRIFGFGDAGLIINIIPSQVNLEETIYANLQSAIDGRLNLTDNKSFNLDIQEFAVNR